MTSDTVLFKGLGWNSFIPSWRVKPAKHDQWIWKWDLEYLLLKSPFQMLPRVITTRNAIIYWLFHIQIPDGNLGVFIYFPGRQTGNRISIFVCLQRKILLDVGSPSEILLFRPAHFQTLLAYSGSVQEDLSAEKSKNTHKVINWTIKKLPPLTSPLKINTEYLYIV